MVKNKGHANLIPAKKGEVRNPNGRGKGSRNKLGEAFLLDMVKDWEKHGVKVIEDVRIDKPDVYLKVVASILPKETNLNINKYEDMTDEQLREQLERVAKDIGALAAFGVLGDDVRGDTEIQH